MRKAFPKVTEMLMKKNEKIFCLLGDIGVFSFRDIFKNYKNRIVFIKNKPISISSTQLKKRKKLNI